MSEKDKEIRVDVSEEEVGILVDVLGQVLLIAVESQVHEKVPAGEKFAVNVIAERRENHSTLSFEGVNMERIMAASKQVGEVEGHKMFAHDMTKDSQSRFINLLAFGERDEFIIEGTICYGKLCITARSDHGSHSSYIRPIRVAAREKMEEIGELLHADDKLDGAKSLAADIINRLKAGNKPEGEAQ